MKNRPRHTIGASSALALVCANLLACADPISGPTDFGDGGVGIAAGQITVHTASTNLPALVANASLSLGTMQAGSDREPASHPTVPLTGALGMELDDPVVVAGATPATYGGVRLLALDSLTVTTTTGVTLVVDFSALAPAPIELRCAGPGKYLDPSGALDMRLSLNFSPLQSALTGAFPPVSSTTIAGSSGQLAALVQGLSVACLP